MLKSLFVFMLLFVGSACTLKKQDPPPVDDTPPVTDSEEGEDQRGKSPPPPSQTPVEKIKNLTPAELSLWDATSIHNLTKEQAQALSKEQIQALTKNQVQSINPSYRNEFKSQFLTPQQLLFFTKTQIPHFFYKTDIKHFIRSPHHSFSPEQISVFTKDQITYLENQELTQILKLLSPSQVKLLTSYQIAFLKKEDLLPLINLLSPEQADSLPEECIPGIPAENLTSHVLKSHSKNLTVEQIQNLNKEQIQMLSPFNLSEDNIRGLIFKLDDLASEQIKDFSFSQFSVLRKLHIDMLLKDEWPDSADWYDFYRNYLRSLTGEQIRHWISAEDLARFVNFFSTEQFTAIPSYKFKKFTFKDLDDIPKNLLPHFSPSGIQHIPAKNIRFLNAPGKVQVLSPEAVKAFTPQQIPHLSLLYFTPEQVHALTKEQIPHLTEMQIQELWEHNFIKKPKLKITEEQTRELPPSEIEKLQAEHKKPDKIYLSSEQITYLTEDQMRMFLPGQIPNFTREDIEAISPVKFSFFSTREYVDGTLITPDLFEQIQAFTPEQMTFLSEAQIQAMRLQQTSFLTAEQVRLMSPLQVMAFSEKQVLVMPQETQKIITTYRQSYKQNLPH